MSAFWSGHVDAAAGCCCRVLLEDATVKVVCARVVLSESCVRFGAGLGVAGCRCTGVLLSKWCVRF